MSSMSKTYSELLLIPTFEDRYSYLKLQGIVGANTFGFDRYINQMFYKSSEWQSLRNEIILRDNGCDLGIIDREIYGPIYIHHMNPLSIDDITTNSKYLLNPEYLICTTQSTHNAIHYGNISSLVFMPKERKPNDVCPWRTV